MSKTEFAATRTGSACPKRRRIFFLDMENYAGKAILDAESVDSVRASITRQFGLHGRDLVVIGASHSQNVLRIGTAWKGPRLVFERGRDGADRALIKAIGQYRLESFSEVYVMSGDGAFCEKVAELAEAGLPVRVVSRGAGLNKRLIAAAPCLLAA